MGLYRDNNGLVFEVDDNFARTHGYEPVSPLEENEMNAQRAQDSLGTDRGIVGDANAVTTGLASGITMGGSDYLLGKLATPSERERLQAELEAHPYERTGSEIAGTVIASMEGAPRTPTGYLSSLASRETEHALAQGGFRGTAKALGVMGAEGAIQNAGAYIGQSAIADKDVTAEGLSGALGTGFAFGTVGGGAALGVSQGSVAFRRLYSRVMDGETALKDAESAWSRSSQELLDADTDTANAAKQRLEDIRLAKEDALKTQHEAKSQVAAEKIRASTYEPRVAEAPIEAPAPDMGPEGPTPLDEGIAPARGGDPTRVMEKPAQIVHNPEDAAAFDRTLRHDEGPTPLDEGIAPASNGPATQIRQPTTKRIERPAEVASVEPRTPLEEQLAGTKAELDSGKSLNEVNPKASKGNEGDASIEQWLAEKGNYDASVGKADKEGLNAMRMRRETGSLSAIRRAHTTELLGSTIAKDEQSLMDALQEFEAARKDFVERVVNGATADEAGRRFGQVVPFEHATENVGKAMGETDVKKFYAERGKSPELTRNGQRPSADVLDEAYEHSLDMAAAAKDPILRGQHLQEADQLEQMLQRLHAEPVGRGVPRDFLGDTAEHAKITERYEKASRSLTEAVGEAAHPTSQAAAKALDEAEKDAVRKVQDRVARSIDDAQQHGPVEMSPKERVAYARNRKLDADNALFDVRQKEKLAKGEYNTAKDKVAAGEQAKAKALKLDAKNQKAAARSAAAGSKAATLGGVLEILGEQVPGLPKPSDLPVIGPLLGAYLKYRTLAKALGKAGVRIPASADARVAILASKTKDRVARAIDRSLGVIERKTPMIRKTAPLAAGVMGRRLYDDGGPDAKDKKNIQELAAVRSRELAAYVSTPGAIEADVRKQLRDVTDPDLIGAAEKHRRAMMEYALSVAPKVPEFSPLQKVDWQPSPAASMSFARTMEALDDPAGVYERLASEQAMISLEAAEALRAVYPTMFQAGQQRLMERAAELKQQVPYRQRIQMSLLYQMPLDSGLQPDNLKITQSVYTRTPPTPPPGAPQPPAPAIAGQTNINQMYQTAQDRNALRR